jgi:tetratricopeptide (TPR) repeat protein
VEDIFDLQNEVARKIADALKVSLTESEEASLAKKPTDDLRAYDFYMRGREYLARRGKKNTETAIRMFESALEIDNEFAAAYAGLAEACSYMYEWYDGSAAWLGRAIEMNQQALARDAGSADARFGIAMVYYHQGRLAEARRTLEAARPTSRHFLPGSGSACLPNDPDLAAGGALPRRGRTPAARR